MEMTELEIVLKYKRAEDKKAQIRVLAELNDCDEETIKRILINNGVPESEVHAKRGRKPKAKKAADEASQERAEQEQAEQEQTENAQEDSEQNISDDKQEQSDPGAPETDNTPKAADERTPDKAYDTEAELSEAIDIILALQSRCSELKQERASLTAERDIYKNLYEEAMKHVWEAI